ncbi:MAG: hypothetical protein KC503_11335 [Myxococcales bacterium]|nr:hypothetical protein [Myxococcales bacterium]
MQKLVSARALEGRVVGNGRYLLLRKVEHTESSACFRAKDMVGGIDVDIEVLRDEERGFRLGRSDVTPRPYVLPDLLEDDDEDGAEALDAAPAPPREGMLHRMRAWLRRRRGE